uniref:Uncharacterized protein n=1 Tax=Chromera velia CCMP2878 TaxID=1169474 RepID=A0A0G4G1K1_9ALVE|eukprot:Cvel_19813.t1-p1 / transcript=Cvel_19813.t1 / gene=Cvel_19813 / organism=Chromera_velia_CCMP2878 / gene_product=hypothetical protein / transcript_product=hypothetical protein / location=Cvel_scaffold1734:16179-16892(+) / protein_length=238 / sequence_SO=supercontig / SO=protein_coding / is_pseudo=false
MLHVPLLECVRGGLSVNNNGGLLSLRFEMLLEVGGSVRIGGGNRDGSSAGNSVLSSVSFLNLRKVGGDLLVEGNESLSNLTLQLLPPEPDGEAGSDSMRGNKTNPNRAMPPWPKTRSIFFPSVQNTERQRERGSLLREKSAHSFWSKDPDPDRISSESLQESPSRHDWTGAVLDTERDLVPAMDFGPLCGGGGGAGEVGGGVHRDTAMLFVGGSVRVQSVGRFPPVSSLSGLRDVYGS